MKNVFYFLVVVSLFVTSCSKNNPPTVSNISIDKSVVSENDSVSINLTIQDKDKDITYYSLTAKESSTDIISIIDSNYSELDDKIVEYTFKLYIPYYWKTSHTYSLFFDVGDSKGNVERVAVGSVYVQ